jgi:hypothetical protein
LSASSSRPGHSLPADQVVDVAQVDWHADPPQEVVVEGVEVQPGGQDLAGVGADRQAAAGRRPVGRQVEPRAGGRVGVQRGADVEDLVEQAQERAVGDAGGQ